MNEKQAREILGDWIDKDGIYNAVGESASWAHEIEHITLDGDFTADQLDAIS